MRTFETGATRNDDSSKYDYEAFLSPIVLERFAQYMHKHRMQADGKLRDGDNWQNGIPRKSYMKSGYRHFHDWWLEHRGYPSREGLEEALCALLFNVQGYLLEVLKEKRANSVQDEPKSKSVQKVDAEFDEFVQALASAGLRVDTNIEKVRSCRDKKTR